MLLLAYSACTTKDQLPQYYTVQSESEPRPDRLRKHPPLKTIWWSQSLTLRFPSSQACLGFFVKLASTDALNAVSLGYSLHLESDYIFIIHVMDGVLWSCLPFCSVPQNLEQTDPKRTMTSLVPRASLFYRQGSAFVAKMWTLPSGCKCKDYEHRAIYTAKKVLMEGY